MFFVSAKSLKPAGRRQGLQHVDILPLSGSGPAALTSPIT